jgi:carbamoyl-phosphate synthase large subunit
VAGCDAAKWSPRNIVRDNINILVLGVGGNVSQGILKALALCNLSCRVVGACISSRSFGLYTVDKAYISPTASDPRFLDWLVRVCRTEQIHAVLSGVEPVLAVLAEQAHTVHSETGAICLVSPSECLAVGADKLLTCRWLQDRGFAFPRYAAAEDAASVNALVCECGYPLIAKPRHGKGAHGVSIVQSDEELQLITQREAYVVQEYLGQPDQEYTAGCFSDREAKVRGAIVLRRELLGGTTYRAEAGSFPSVRQEAIRIAEALRPTGPCNLQMRLHRDIAVCFEINIRFSGTTSLRARFGFNDVEAALRHYVLGQPAADLPLVTRGIALRYWNEAYVDLEAVAELDRFSQLDRPKRYKIAIEDYGIPQ